MRAHWAACHRGVHRALAICIHTGGGVLVGSCRAPPSCHKVLQGSRGVLLAGRKGVTGARYVTPFACRPRLPDQPGWWTAYTHRACNPSIWGLHVPRKLHIAATCVA